MPPNYSPDFKPQEHETFSACTLGVHKIEESDDVPFTSHLQIDRKDVFAGNSILEMPSMLSGHGVEPGTVGFEHFLQLSIADSLVAPDEAATFNKRHLLVSSPGDLGLGEFDLSQLVESLTEAGNIYTHLADSHATTQLVAEERVLKLGESLFNTLLTARTTTAEEHPGLTLEAQIDALQQVLEHKGLWHDFSLVEWRIRVGQLLWTDFDADYISSDDAIHHLSERDVFMLQITLSAELLFRVKMLEARKEGDNEQQTHVRERSLKVEWDLLLAHRFLTNMSVSVLPNGKAPEKGIRNSFFSAISFFAAESDPQALATQPILRPKNEDDQIDGLMTFARTLNWPHAEDVYAQLRPEPDNEGNERPVSMVSIYATPLNSPRLFNMDDTPGTRTSYFGALALQQQQKRPGVNRTATTQSIQLRPAGNEADGFNVGGWLSRSWLSGLVLPGEPVSHFLISTLLENSPKAISVLGDSADLYGGFVYEGRTFWSKSSAVARVLAASSGAVECMGWISVPSVPTACADGWVNAKVHDFPYSSAQPRIKHHEALAKTSDPFHGAEASRLRASDFTVPTDSPPVMGNEVVSHGLSFGEHEASSPSSSSSSSSAMEEQTAHLTFSSPINAKLPRITVPLTYDIHFISSQPCYPVPPTTHPETVGSFSSSPSENLALSFSTSSIADTPPPAHPLHTSYRYMTLPVAMLLSAETRSRALSLPDQKAEAEAGEAEEEEEVAVLDCRGKADLELLARAWCAKVGENAIIGRVGRTCLACCIREARGLGVRVVIRT